ncbi:MAG: tetratricopeptide repeat protein [Bryobacteraceae bacterium]
MARITRKELKTDKFALEVEHTVTFFDEHRQELVRYGGIALGVAVLIAGYLIYAGREHVAREAALAHAIEVQEAGVGGVSATGGLSFPTQDAKDKEAIKVFSDLKNKYSGSMEGEVAQYYLGSILADQGNLAQAEKSFQEAAEKGDARYASLAKLSLAQIYFSDGRDTQGEGMLRDLIAHPTVFVSSEQATITLARYLANKKPAEARKLLEPLRSQPGSVGQIALTILGEMMN